MRPLIALLGFAALGLAGIVTWQLAAELVADLPKELGEAEQRTLRVATWLSALSFGSLVLSVLCTVGYLWLLTRRAAKSAS